MKSNDFNHFESMVNDSLFAIVDIETTGFSPKRGDKIIEIGIITTNLQGEIVDKFETLINPDREVSGTHIHKITAEMVKTAPKIEEVIETIIYHLNNKTIVGHNIDFDLRFINHEISKYLEQDFLIKGLCTIQLSRFIEIDIPARRLESFCEFYDIETPSSHSAIGDCESTLELFHIFKSELMERLGINEFVDTFTNPIAIKETSNVRKISFKRKEAAKFIKQESNRLFNKIRRLPSNPADSIPVQQYLNLLDNILADRIITESEVEILIGFINEFGISKEQAIEVHKKYLRNLSRVYLLDNILSQSELQDLKKVAGLLCLTEDSLEKIIEFEKANIAKQQIVIDRKDKLEYEGKSICFTGQLISRLDGKPIDRSLAQQLAIERGLIIKSGVSKNLDYLITADPNSLSGKSRKAKDFGVKILAEPVFWSMIGIAVE